MKRTTILYVITTFQVDGPGTYLKGLVASLDKTRYDIHVCCLYHDGPMRSELEAAGATAHVLTMASFMDVRVLGPLLAIIRRLRPEIVHTLLLRADLYGRLASILGGVKLRYSTIVNMDDYRQQSAWHERILIGLDRWLALRSERLITLSEVVRDYTAQKEDLPLSKFKVIPSQIDLTAIPQDFTYDYQRPSKTGRVVIGTAGRLHPQKGQDALIRAFKLIADQCPQAELHIMGEGPLGDELQELARALGLAERVRFVGYRSDFAQALLECDVYVMTSRWEGGAPIAILTAMVMGVPCVSTVAGGIESFVQDGVHALLAPVDDEATIAASIMRLAQDRSFAQRMGAATADHIRTNFSSQRVAAMYNEMYQQDLTGKGIVTG